MRNRFFIIAIMVVFIFSCSNPFFPEKKESGETANPVIPEISSQPQSAVYTVGATAVALTVNANVSDGGVLSYQWYNNTANNTNGTAINGEESSSYTPPTNELGTIYYYVIVKNTLNGKTATAVSYIAKIEINDKVNVAVPQIDVQPQSAEYAVGDTAEPLTVSVTISDDGDLTFQWYSNTVDSNENGDEIDGETDESFTPPTDELGTVYYYVIVTNTIIDNGDGGNKVVATTSDTAEIIVALYIVTFDSNGGSNISAQLILEENAVILRPQNPERSGYMFDYWYLNGIPYNFDTFVTESITLQARWVSDADITAMAAKDFVWVAGGSFQMGKHLGTASGSDVIPVHTVTLTGYWMSKYQVTQEKYFAVMQSNPSYFTIAATGENAARLPVEMVSWYDALVFCNILSDSEVGVTPAYEMESADVTGEWTTDTSRWGVVPDSNTERWNDVRIVSGSNGYRLPTEAQWEYAAKGGQKSIGYSYSGSNDPSAVAWHDGKTGTPTSSRTHEVGILAHNELGIYDMSGNIWEWCWDRWGSYTETEKTDPTGVSTGFFRMLRGGCWDDLANQVSSVLRNANSPHDLDNITGFRLLRP